MPRATVLLADDHAVVAEGLASLLRSEFTVVGTVTDGARLLEAARQLRPDVVVTDLAMPGMSGLDALRRLRADALAASPAPRVPKVIVLTMHADPELAAAIGSVLRGKTYLSPELAPTVVGRLAEPGVSGREALTPRQREVVRLLADGRTMKEAAASLGVSPRTVETHKYQIMATLGLRSNAELIRYAIEHGLATPSS